MDNSKVFAMKLSKVYPLLVAKAERKGHTVQEVEDVLFWLTGYDKEGLDVQLARDVDYGTFFEKAPLHASQLCSWRFTRPMVYKIKRRMYGTNILG